jgi:hypothetical protein
VRADGTEIVFDSYEGVIRWDGHARRLSIDSAETKPLLGMALLNGRELVIQVREGGMVRIQDFSASK